MGRQGVVQKKGQVTIYVIVGILLLLGVSLYFLLIPQRTSPVSFLEKNRDLVVIEDYVQICLEQTTKDALMLLGRQGGYIQVPDDAQHNPRYGLSLNPARSSVTPVWVSNGKVLIPSEETMIEQMETYIEENMQTCIGALRTLNNKNQITVGENPQAQVIISDSDVSVKLKFAFYREDNSGMSTKDDFTYSVAIPLRSIMKSASDMALAIHNDEFLSYATLNLMSISDPLIPLSNIQFRCGPSPEWSEQNVRKDLQRLLTYMAARIRVQGSVNMLPFERAESEYAAFAQYAPSDTLSYENVEDVYEKLGGLPDDSYEYLHWYYRSNLANTFSQNKMDVGFSYEPSYGLEMSIKPNDNGKLKAKSAAGQSQYLRFFCIHSYHFTYDLIAPFMVNVKIADAFEDGEDFILRFGAHAVLDNNIPTNTYHQFDFSSPEEGSRDFCQETRRDPTAIFVQNAITGEPLLGAQVRFECVTKYCDLGKTTSQYNGVLFLQAKTPLACTGGSFYVNKTGFVPKETDVYDRIPQTVEVDLLPIADVSWRVRLGKNAPAVVTKDISNGKLALIHLKALNYDYETYTSYAENEYAPLQLLNAPSVDYNVTIIVYDANDNIIGGYMDTVTLKNTDLSRRVIFYAYDFVQPQKTDAQILRTYSFLENKTYVADYKIQII